MLRIMGEPEISTLLGQPALVQLIDKADSGKNEKEKKELRKKVETQCKSFDGKGKLTVDDYYSVLKVQVRFFRAGQTSLIPLQGVFN